MRGEVTLPSIVKIDGKWYQRISINGVEKIRVVAENFIKQHYRDLYNKEKMKNE